MKKLLVIIGSFFALVLLAAIVLPIIFKDDIKKAIDQAIAENVNAHVYYDADELDLSLIRHFPNVSVGLKDFGVVNKAPFEGDTLLAVQSFDIVVNLKSLLFDDQPRISSIQLDQPNVYVQVLEDGTANYDIAVASEDTTTVETDTASSNVSIRIDHWEISNGNIVYKDLSLPMLMVIQNLNHTGNGDFTMDVFDMVTETKIDQFSVNYDGIEYITRKKLAADITLNMDLENFKFTFKENTVAVNDFNFGFDGFFAMPEEDMNMDITFAAKDNSFKSLLSLVPGAYLEGFEDVKTEGSIDFKGFVKGTYNETTMPTFQLNLLAENGMFQYPDLPTPVTNINLNMLVDNQDGNIDNTIVNVKSFHADLGSNPLDVRFLLDGLAPYKIDTEVKTKLNLAELTRMFPMDSLDLKGNYHFNLVANGVYDSASHQFPKVDMAMSLQNGYVKSGDYPPLENISFASTVKNETGNMAQTVVQVNNFDMTLAGEQFNADLLLTNLEDYTWDVKANGTVNLEKLTQIYTVEDMQLAGIIKANIQSKGKMSDVEAERYGQMATNGSMSIQNFKYISTDLPQGFTINHATGEFNPERITLKNFEGTAGKSDMRMSGYLANYLGYALADNETLRGQLNFKSGKFDLNEWMTEDSTAVAEDTAEAALEVVEIPKNIDFVLQSSIAEVLYDDMTLNNVNGNLIVKDGVLRMEGLKFNSLDGQFAMSGTYDTRDLQKPAFDFDLDINNLEIPKAYATFNTVQALAPIAKNMKGTFSTDFKIAGLLMPDMSPDLNTISGKGIVLVNDASVQDSKLVGVITKVTKLNNSKDIKLSDVKIKAEIKDGRVFVEPFDVNMGNFKTVVAGSNGIDGSLDYLMKMTVPAGAVGTAVNTTIARLTGNSDNVSSNIKVNLKVTGHYDDPKVNLAGAEAGESPAQSAKTAVEAKAREEAEKLKAELEKQKQAAEAEAKRKAEEAKRQAEQKAKEKTQEVKQEVKQEAEEAKQEIKKEAQKKLKKVFQSPY